MLGRLARQFPWLFGWIGSRYYRAKVRYLNDLGQHEQAHLHAEAACGFAREVFGPTSRQFGMALAEAALIEMDLGEYDAAAAKLRKAIEIMEEAGSELDQEALYANWGCLNLFLNDLPTAERYLTRSLQLQRTLLPEERHDRLQPSRQALAKLYRQMGDFERALDLQLEVLNGARRRPGRRTFLVARILDVAHDYETLQRYDEAETLFKEAAEIAREIPDAQDRSAPRSMRGLANYYRRAGDFDAAEALLRHAIAVESDRFNASRAGSLYQLGLLLQDRGNYLEAESFLMEALAIRRGIDGEKSWSLIDVLYALSRTARPGGEGQSLEWMREAEIIQDEVIRHVVSFASEQERLAYLARLRGQFEACLSLVFFSMRSEREAIRLAYELVLRRKAIASGLMAMQRERILQSRYPELKKELQELASLRATIAHSSVRMSKDDLRPSEEQLKAWKERKRELERRISAGASIEWDEELFPIGVEQVAAALPEGAALLEFVRFMQFRFDAVPEWDESRWGEAHYAAFVLRAGQPDSLDAVVLGKAAEIDSLIAVARRGAAGRHFSPDGPLSTTDVGATRRLGAILLDPLVCLVKGCKRLFLAPEGDLCFLPFECLILESGSLLIDAGYLCSYVNCGREVPRFSTTRRWEARSPEVAGPLVIADPDFDASPLVQAAGQNPALSGVSRDFGGRLFRDLPGTRQEGEEVARMLHVSPFLRLEAEKSRLIAADCPAVLHVATHGYFLSDQTPVGDRETSLALERLTSLGAENPLFRSGLVFAGANLALRGKGELSRSVLSAWEVTGMNLAHTELAVLSACETGFGEVHESEGVLGLRQAFAIAGVKTLIMSLWRVDDEATRKLMTSYWSKLQRGMGCAEALAQAQRQLKRQPGYEDPRYWAGFICLGDPAPLPDWMSGKAAKKRKS